MQIIYVRSDISITEMRTWLTAEAVAFFKYLLDAENKFAISNLQLL